ncbi:MAG: glutamine amidotransferase [Acidimicrobiales bacterium]|nr:MAG: glutamine amidotransferase [Acidimicrobiales bacterium]
MPGPQAPGASGRQRDSAVTIVVVHPDLLGTYGDGGNAVVLAQRLRWRGVAAEVIEIASDQAVPASADLYCLGGGEDGPQTQSAAAMAAGRPLTRAMQDGAVVLAVCAGYQVVGESFAGSDGQPRAGLGLLDVRAAKGVGLRAVGEVVCAPVPELGLPTLTGYENHGGLTTLGPSARPLAQVRTGVGNGGGDGTEGALGARVVGTYLHGPLLARNPALADLLLSWVVGPLDPLDDTEVMALRTARLTAARGGRSLPRAPRGKAPLAARLFRRPGQPRAPTASG